MVATATWVALAVTAVVPLAVAAGLLWVAETLPPRPVARIAEGLAAVGAVGAALAYPALPEAGLVVPPIVVLPVATLVFAGVVRFRPALSPPSAAFGAAGAVAAGLAVFFLRGVLRFGLEFPAQAVRPPSLVLSSVALALIPLSFFALGRVTGTGSGERWPFVLAVVVLSVETVVSAVWRPYNFAGLLLPVTFAVVAVLFGVPAFRLGYESGREARRRSRRRPR